MDLWTKVKWIPYYLIHISKSELFIITFVCINHSSSKTNWFILICSTFRSFNRRFWKKVLNVEFFIECERMQDLKGWRLIINMFQNVPVINGLVMILDLYNDQSFLKWFINLARMSHETNMKILGGYMSVFDSFFLIFTVTFQNFRKKHYSRKWILVMDSKMNQ